MSRAIRCLALPVVLAMGLLACGRSDAPPEPLRPVLTRVLGETAAAGGASYAGEVRSRYETQLGFRIAGKIAERRVDAGATVKAGEVLARLDPVDAALSAAAAAAQLELAEADARRYRELRGKNFVSQAALDAKETALTAAKSQADLARNQSGYTTLKADHAGVVAAVLAEVGTVVSAGQPVMRVARNDALEVAVAIPETQVGAVRGAKELEVSLWSDASAKYRGSLRELSVVADPATRTYAARVSIANPDARILLGMTANVRFISEDADSRLLVPLTAIFQQDGKPAVWLVGADEAVSLRQVVVASWGETSAIIDSGVKAGERIVVAGVHKLTAGEKIRAVDQKPAQ